MNEIERYLADCESAEAGKFTLDPARQRDLLVRLGLSDPQFGFLKLAQAAVQSGAGRMDWRPNLGAREVQFRYPLLQPPPQPLWTASGGALPLAVLALSQQYELNWRWQVNEVARAGLARGNHFQEQEIEPFGGAQRLELTIRDTRRRWFGSFTNSVRRLLAECLAWAGVLVGWGDEYLNRVLRGEAETKLPSVRPLAGQALLLAETPNAGNLWLPDRLPSERVHYLLGELRGEEAKAGATLAPISKETRRVFQGWAALWASGSSWSETTFVIDGVTTAPERNLLDRPGITAVVSAAGLKTDLGGLTLVHDDAFRARLASLKPAVRWLTQS